MFSNKQILRIPGPTPIPPSVQNTMAKPMIGHRETEAKQLMEQILPGLKKIFGTTEDVLVLTNSGTGGLETAVVNSVSENGEVLVVVTGAFGERFAQICEAHAIKTYRLECNWGSSANVNELIHFLKAHPNIEAVFFTYCETSTGVLNPIQQLSQAVQEHSNALIIVDGVSAIGGANMQFDDWGIDICVTGSQKAMMLPPGLCFIAVSERAWKVIEQNKRSRFYFDLRKYKDKLLDYSTPFTPAVSLLFGLNEVLNLVQAEGIDNIYKRHLLMRNMTRSAFKTLNIPLLTNEEDASPTVTAVKPNNNQANILRQVVNKEFGLVLAGGPAHLKGKIFRIGHMGYCYPADVLQYISLIELGLSRISEDIQIGAGITAAQKVYLQQAQVGG